MDVVLVSIAALSLTLAIAMGVILFYVLREDRQRSDARVALLVAAAASIDPPAADAETEPIDVPLDQGAVVREDLFARREERSPWTRRFGVAAAFAACVALGGYLVLPRGSGLPSASAATSTAPLELLTLGHTQEPDSLTITGMVHNPRNGVPLKQVVVTAVVFGDGGVLLTSGRANLDFALLGPGDESPFVIKVPVTGVVTRYRVGFRSPDGAVISHVDRRSDSTSARHAAASGSTPWAQ